jgi:hypothetical protein
VRRWAIGLALCHAAIVVIVFAAAYLEPARRGLLPIAIFVLDYPCSIIVESVRRSWHQSLGVSGLGGRLAIDAVAYLTIGSVWYGAVGAVIGRIAHEIGDDGRP